MSARATFFYLVFRCPVRSARNIANLFSGAYCSLVDRWGLHVFPFYWTSEAFGVFAIAWASVGLRLIEGRWPKWEHQ